MGIGMKLAKKKFDELEARVWASYDKDGYVKAVETWSLGSREYHGYVEALNEVKLITDGTVKGLSEAYKAILQDIEIEEYRGRGEL